MQYADHQLGMFRSTRKISMKLLYCKECNSVFNLDYEEKLCTCGKSKGKYIDNLNAEYSGPCVSLGFNNFSFFPAINNQPKEGWGKNFEAFVIPLICPTMKKLDMDDKDYES